MELSTTYFEKPGGEENTVKTFVLAKARADALGIKTFVVASTTGATAVKAMDALKGYKIIIVTHAAGYCEPNSQEFTEENRKIVEKKGGIIVTAAHALGSIQRALAPPTTGAAASAITCYRRCCGDDAADVRPRHEGVLRMRRHGRGRRARTR